MTTYQYTTPPYQSGLTVTVQPLLLGVAVGTPLSATALAVNAAMYGVNLIGVGPSDTLLWTGGVTFAVSSINWNGTAEVSNVTLATDIAAIGENITIDNYIIVPPAVAVASQNPAQITIVTGDSFADALPLLGNITGWTKLIFSIKTRVTDPDSAAIVEVVLNSGSGSNGLLVLNGATPSDPTQGSLSVVNVTTGAVNCVLTAATSAALNPASIYWGVKVITPTAEWTLPGDAEITSGIIDAIA